MVQLANLDSRLLLLFVNFLKKICNVSEKKICLTVQLYKKFNKDRVKDYWSKTLKIPKELIKVNLHTDNRSKPGEQWSKFGIARIEVRNVKLKQWVDNALEVQLNSILRG